MTEENSSPWTLIMIKLLILIVLTGLPIAGMLTLLVLAGIVPNTWIGQTLLITGFVFFLGTIILLATKNLLYWAYSLLVGFAIGIGCIVLAFLALLSMISVPFLGNAAWLVIIISLILVSSISSYLWDRKNPVTPKEIPMITTSSKTTGVSRFALTSIRKKSTFMQSVELIELPRDYAYSEDKKHSVSEMIERFHSIVRHLTLSSVPFALRFQRMDWKTRVIFFTWANDENRLHHYQTVLYDTLSSNLTGFRFEKTPSFTGIDLDVEDTGSVISITGVPLSIEEDSQRKDPLEAMTSVLQELENGIVQITLTPSGIDKSQLGSLESRYRTAVEQSETTVSKTKSGLFSGDRQESKTIVNPEKKRRAEALQRQIERLSTPHLCKVAVTTAAWGQNIATSNLDAQRIASALVGAIRPDNKMEEFQLEYKNKRNDIVRILHGVAMGKTSTLTPKEATTYFILPRTDIGIRVTTREKFSSGTQESATAPTKEPEPQDMMRSLVPSKVKWLRRVPKIFIGNPIDEKGNLLAKSYVLLDPDKLDMHLGIFGNIRFGKTSTALSVVSQAITLGLNPIVLVPSKGYEWRKLIDIFPDIRVFTCGNDKAALLSVNIWDPPPGVSLEKWRDRVVQALTLWLPSNEPFISMHIETLVDTVYKNCGWNMDTDTKGRPILLSNLVEAVTEVITTAGYSVEGSSNTRGILVTRIRSILNKPSLVKLFNTASGITITELLSHPTIIEMDSLSLHNKTLLMGILTAAICEYKMANPSQKVTNLLVLEEAHYLLRKGTMTGEAHSGGHVQAIMAFMELLRVLGGTGLGVVLIDQLPSRLVDEAIRLPVNMVIHTLNHEDDRRIVGKHARCTEAQIEHIGGMQVGEVVVYLQSEGEPKNVKILLLEKLLAEETTKRQISDNDIREHMSKVFEDSPDLCMYEPLPEGIMDRLNKIAQQSVVPESNDSLLEFLNTLEVVAFCDKKIASGTGEDIKKLGAFLRQALASYGTDPMKSVLFLIRELRERYEKPDNASIFDLLFDELVAIKE